MDALTRKQYEIIQFLIQNQSMFPHPPSLDQLCTALGLKSRGSLHRIIQDLIAVDLIEAMDRKHRGVRLTEKAKQMQPSDASPQSGALRYVGVIAAGKPIEAIENIEYMQVPDAIKTEKDCYVLKVKGDSMVDEGICDGDWVIIEQRCHARNGEIVVALIDKEAATLKFIEQYPHETLLIPANANMQTMRYQPSQVEIQGVLVGQMRSYR